jgi:hypothetical protein
VDTDTTNIIIFIWTDDGTITASDAIGFAEWQLNPGSTVNDFSSPGLETVQDQVDLYLQRYDYSGTTQEAICGGGAGLSNAALLFMFQYRKSMRAIPTVTSSAAGTFKGGDGTALAAGTVVAFSEPPIGDQLDALWKGGQPEADMKLIIDGVKATHPKVI